MYYTSECRCFEKDIPFFERSLHEYRMNKPKLQQIIIKSHGNLRNTRSSILNNTLVSLSNTFSNEIYLAK